MLGQSASAFFNSSPRTVPNMSAHRPDYLFQTVIGVWEVRLSLLKDIASSTSGFCAVLSRDLDAHERSLSFTYGKPEESWSSLQQMYFGKRRASRINLFWSC